MAHAAISPISFLPNREVHNRNMPSNEAILINNMIIKYVAGNFLVYESGAETDITNALDHRR